MCHIQYSLVLDWKFPEPRRHLNCLAHWTSVYNFVSILFLLTPVKLHKGVDWRTGQCLINEYHLRNSSVSSLGFVNNWHFLFGYSFSFASVFSQFFSQKDAVSIYQLRYFCSKWYLTLIILQFWEKNRLTRSIWERGLFEKKGAALVDYQWVLLHNIAHSHSIEVFTTATSDSALFELLRASQTETQKKTKQSCIYVHLELLPTHGKHFCHGH